MANMIARLGVLLGLDSAEFRKGIAAASKDLDKFVSTAKTYGTIAVASFAAASVKAMQFADELSDVAKANDTTIRSILSLQNALQMSGGKAENAGKMLASFTQYVDTAAKGSLDAQRAFARAGVGLGDLAKLDAQALLGKTVSGLAAIPDTLTRNAIAFDAFGRAAKGVDFVGLNKELGQTSAITDEQSAGIQAAADAWDKFDEASRRVSATITAALGPSLLKMADLFSSAVDKIQSVIDAWKRLDFAASASIVFKFMVGRHEDAAQELERLQSRIMGGGSGLRNADDPRRLDRPLGRTVKPGVDKEAEAGRKRYIDSLVAGVQGLIDEEERLDQILRGIEDARNKADKAQKEQQRTTGLGIERAHELFMLEMKTSDLRAEDAVLERELMMIRNDYADRYRELSMDILMSKDARLEAMREEDALMARAVELAHARNEAIKQSRQGTFADGFFGAAERFFKNVPTELETGEKAFHSVMGNMESALDNFVRSGKLSFKDLARSIIQDLIAIQLKASATTILGSLMKSFGGGYAGMTAADVGAVTGVGHAANGGPISGPTIVGELGPELFIPRTAGTVIPNNRMNSIGGTTNITNYNIQAIDTKSFEERILGSSKAVWAANAYGAKGLALGGGRA